MKKMGKKFILLGSGMLIVLALAMPQISEGTAYVGGYISPPPPAPEPASKPIVQPIISGISPKEADIGTDVRITIVGTGFSPASVARVNGANRPTTFIDTSHLMMQPSTIDMRSSDGGFFITVWDSSATPGEEYSNSAYFTLKGTLPKEADPLAYRNNPYPYGYGNNAYNTYELVDTRDRNDDVSSLASSVILGERSFLPSGLVQWVLTAILLVVIIILARRLFGARHNYESSPLKHA